MVLQSVLPMEMLMEPSTVLRWATLTEMPKENLLVLQTGLPMVRLTVLRTGN